MKAVTNKLEIAMAELSVLMKTVVIDVADIKSRLAVMNEQFAHKDDLKKSEDRMNTFSTALQTQEINLAVTRSQLKTWGIVGGIVVTLVSAFISALQVHF